MADEDDQFPPQGDSRPEPYDVDDADATEEKKARPAQAARTPHSIQRPARLNYRPAGEMKPLASTAVQVGLGFLSWVGLMALVAAAFWTSSNTEGGVAFSYVASLLALVAFTMWCTYVHSHYQWRAFVAGVLLGLGVTCLLPVGIVAVLCGGWRI